MNRALWIGGLAVGGAAVVTGIFLATKSSSSTPTAQSVVVKPGSMTLAGLPRGSQLALALPSGGMWQSLSVDGDVRSLKDYYAPITITTTQVSGTITLSWVDASKQPQSTAIAYGL